MSNTPWWWIPTATGIFAFVGVVVAQTVTLVIDGLKRRREDRWRLHTDRRRLYASLIQEVSAMTQFVTEKITNGEPYRGVDQERIGVIFGHYQEVRLIGSDDVINAATAVTKEAMNVWKANESWEVNHQAQIRLASAIEAFVNAGRRNLGSNL